MHFPLATPLTVSFSFLCLFSFTSYLLYLFWPLLSQLGLWFCNFWNKCRCRPCKGETKWYNRRGTQNWGAFLISYFPACLFLLFCSPNIVPDACFRMMHVCMCVFWINLCVCGILTVSFYLELYLLCVEVIAMYILNLTLLTWPRFCEVFFINTAIKLIVSDAEWI